MADFVEQLPSSAELRSRAHMAISTRNDAPINSYIAEITRAAHLTAWNHRSMKPPKSLFFYLCDGVLYLHPSDMVSFKTDLKRLEKANKATTGKERNIRCAKRVPCDALQEDTGSAGKVWSSCTFRVLGRLRGLSADRGTDRRALRGYS